MGNLHSVELSFKRLKREIKIVQEPTGLKGCDALVLPGVGAFDPAMKNLGETGLVPFLKQWVKDKKPLLGICLGLQLLFESSDEGNAEGLGLLKGHVYRLPSDQGERVPHMGWAPLIAHKESPLIEKRNKNSWMYFVHSFAVKPTNQEDLAASVKFGEHMVAAIVWKDQIGACQFHPEKSSRSGQKMLEKWLKWIEIDSLKIQ